MDKKAILISGANGNLGSYATRYYLKNSDKHLILIIHKKDYRIKDIIKSYAKRVTLIKCDIANDNDVKKNLLINLEQNNIIIEDFLHTASVRSSDFTKLVDTDYSNWEMVFKTNVTGTYNLLKAVLPIMRKNKYGKIVFLSSNVTRLGLPNGSAYSASKAAISNLVRTLSVEEAENNILINAVSPGPIKIDNSDFSKEYTKFRDRYYDEMLKAIPLKRLASIKDIFEICDFLLSKKNSYITGEEIFATGGKL